MQQLPPNTAAVWPIEVQKAMMMWLMTNFVWPQIWHRLPFETKWNHLNAMYKVQADRSEVQKRRGRNWRGRNDEENAELETLREKEVLADSLIFDTVDRLKNLNFFISWKDGTPVQYNRPRFLATPMEDMFYHPTSDKIKAANALVGYNLDASSAKLKDLKLKQHLYLYGCGFVQSEFRFQFDETVNAVVEAYTDFEPTSIRKLWLNLALPLDQMDRQPCPFLFDIFSRFQILGNIYHPIFNPTGFVNLELIQKAEWPVSQETKAWRDAINTGGEDKTASLSALQTRPEFTTEALWTFYPYLPVDEQGMFNEAGRPIRFIIQVFSNNLIAGQVMPVRIQPLYYPKGRLPIYGVSNIPDLDSGAYTPSIGSLLENHYHELVTAKQQYLDNKNWINNPPSWHVSGSLSKSQDCNSPGVKIEVTSPDEMGWRTPFDATFTTKDFIQSTREQAQVTGKAVDALLGKAMGGRTTATEASNAFQAGMSGVTTDVDYTNSALYGGYAIRVWENSGVFLDDDLLKRITGSRGVHTLTMQDLNVRVGIKTDVGSTFIESIVKQQHLRYAIEASTRSPALDQPMLWKAFFHELKLTSAIDAVIDGGAEFEISKANEQAIKTFLGERVIIDPTQNHEAAIRVKTRYLEDQESYWNENFAGMPSAMFPNLSRAQDLAQQIALHQQFFMIQQQQLMLQMQAQQEMQTNEQMRLEDNKAAHKAEAANRPKHSEAEELRGRSASVNQ